MVTRYPGFCSHPQVSLVPACLVCAGRRGGLESFAGERGGFSGCDVGGVASGCGVGMAALNSGHRFHFSLWGWLHHTYFYGIIVCMIKKTLNVSEELLEEAKKVSGATTDTETVRLGLEALVRHAAYERLRSLRGSEPDAKDVPRRREKAAAKGRL